MKNTTKFLFLSLGLLMAAPIFGQEEALENGSFEQWDNVTNSNGEIIYYEPSGTWITNNLVSTVNDETGPYVTRETERVHSGTYAVKGISGLFSPGSTLPVGAVTAIGAFELNFLDQAKSYIPGAPFSSRPDFMRGHFIYEPVSIGDTGAQDACDIYIHLRNCTGSGETQVCDTIGTGAFSTSETISAYQEIVIPIEYTNETPINDMYVVFATSKNAAPPAYAVGIGSSLIVDDFELIYGDLDNNISIPLMAENQVTVFPNPTSDFITLEQEKATATDFLIFDIQGKLIMQYAVHSQKQTFSLQNLAVGTYIYQIKNAEAILGGGQFQLK